MALKKAQIREILSAAGVTAEHMEEAVDKIIDGHAATVAALKEEMEGYRSASEKLSGVQSELDTLKATAAAEAKAREGKDYDALKKEYDNFRADVDRKAKEARATAALRDLLHDMNVGQKGVEKILKWQGVNGVELGEDGKITNAAALRKSIKEDWGEYIETPTVRGAETATPPSNTGGAKTKEEIMAIKDATERQAAIAENLGLFGIKT